MKYIIIALSIILFSCSQKNDRTNRNLTQEQTGDTTYCFHLDINKTDSAFIYVVRCTTHIGLNEKTGEMRGFYPQSLFYGYDSTVVDFKGLNVIPRNEGRTKIYLRNPFNMKLTADSIIVFVTRFHKKLEISTQRTA